MRDSAGVRNGYGSTLLDALHSRIKAPVTECWQQRRACFFKPYQSLWQGVGGAFDGLYLPVFTALSALELLGIFGGSPYVMVAVACIPAVFELISGFVSLGQSLYYKVKFSHNQTAEKRARSGEYFQDAIIRFAMVIPLAVVSMLAVPVEFIGDWERAFLEEMKGVKPEIGESIQSSLALSDETKAVLIEAIQSFTKTFLATHGSQ